MEKERKEVKKNKKEQIHYAQGEQATELKSFLIIVLVVLLCGALVYILTRAFVTKDLFTDKKSDTETKEEATPVEVNYDVAIVGQLLNMPEKEYYVVVYDTKEGNHISEMSSLVYSYNSLEKHNHVYTIDLSNKLNADYYDPENVNTNAKSVSELHFGDTTLIKVKNKAITKYITEIDSMKKELGVK